MRKQIGAMGSPYRSSYYKAAYEAAASGITSKRYLTREPSSRYYDDPDDRKRHRTDSGGHSQTSSRHASHDEYSQPAHRSSTSSSYNGKGSSGYYEGSSQSHSRSEGRSSNGAYPPPLFRSSRDPEPSGSSSYSHSRDRGSSSRYTEHSSGSGRYDDFDKPSSSKSVPRRAPPHPGSQSSRSKSGSSSSMIAPTPLMKLTVNTEKDYIGSRYRQAPPEHHRENGHSSAYRSASRHSSEHRSRPAASSIAAVPSRSSRPVLTKKPSRVSAISASSRIRKRVMQRSVREREAQTRRILDLKNTSSKAKSRSKPSVSARSTSHKPRAAEAEKPKVSTIPTVSAKSVAKISTSKKEHEVRERSEDPKNEKETKTKSEPVEKTKSQPEKSIDLIDKPVKSVNATASSPEKCPTGKAVRKDRDTLLMLKCHYCDTRCLSWKEYMSHTRSYEHTKALNKAISKMRNEISLLRGKQRDYQRQLEKSTAESKTLSDTTSYCRVCELNFRTDATEHESAELHNKIKGLIYQKCEVCDVEFRIWKVYMNHMTSLEHVKRQAMLELQNREGRGEAVHGTNLSEKELGLSLVEEIQVLYCKACRRYVPIKDSAVESKLEHCTTFNHVKSVDDHNAAEEREARRRLRQVEEKAKLAETTVSDPVAVVETSTKSCSDGSGGTENASSGENESNADLKTEPKENVHVIIKKEVEVPEIVEPESSENIMKMEIPENVDDVQREEEEDDDEIELHADADVDADEEDSETGNSWGRRTRSRANKNATGGGGN